MPEYTTDPKRIGGVYQEMTLIQVRARGPKGFDVFDIAELSRNSLLDWLRQHGGANVWAENVVLVLLGHPVAPHIFDLEKPTHD